MEHEVEPQLHGGFEMRENNKPEAIVITLAKEGLRYGHGSIGVEDRLSDDNDPLTQKDVSTVKEISRSAEALVPVDLDENGEMLDDDGCPDGRKAGWIEKAGKTLKRSLRRAKVFGGSVVMTAAARVGIGAASEQKQEELFEVSCDQLDESGIGYGAHCGEQVGEVDSGCGAIDKFEDHLESAEKYRKQISRSAFELVRATGFNRDKDEREVGSMIDSSLDNFREYRHNFQPAKGSKIFNAIRNRFKVVKGLLDDHKEIRILINMVFGHTIDQDMIRERTGGRAQVFAIDAWRMLDVIDRNDSIPEEKKEQAFVSELIYSLAVAATLTKGDLPIDLIMPKENT